MADWVDFGIDVTPRCGGNYAMMAELRNARDDVRNKFSIMMEALENVDGGRHITQKDIVDIATAVVERYLGYGRRHVDRPPGESYYMPPPADKSWVSYSGSASGQITYSTYSSNSG